MPRFAILEHTGGPRGVHWDLLLEHGEVLRTWALAEPPQPGRSVPAEALPDHRPMYLDFEGEVSGGRGTVVRWDAGEFEWLAEGAAGIELAIRGAKVRGRLRIEPDPPRPQGWRVTWSGASPGGGANPSAT